MKFTFTDKKGTQNADVRAYAEKKVGKLDRYFPTEGDAVITFTVEKNRSKAEVTLRAGGTLFRGVESSPDMYGSIDAAVGSIERQIRKNKTRLARRIRVDAFERTASGGEVSSLLTEEPEEETYSLVRSKKFALKPMSVEEAILQMNLLGHSFFAFRNQDDDDAFAVVYTRNDGGYGLIEDE